MALFEDHQICLVYDEDSQLVTNCHQLKMTATEGKQHLTDVAAAKTRNKLTD